MKTNIKIAAIAVAALVSFTSCDDFLDVTQPSVYTESSLFNTPADCEASVAGIYAQLQNVYNRNYMEAIILREDCIKNSNKQITRFTDTPLEGQWVNAYKGLWVLAARCNKLLSNIDKVQFPDSDQKDHLKGEALAMRGLAYLQFAWCWGGVPLITSDVPLGEMYTIKRATQQETFEQAVKDFQEAYNLLPEKRTGAEIGRVTKYAMAAMLGRTYMYMHNYEDAAKWLKEVVDKEPSLYKLASRYEDCFDDKFDNSPERVWEVQYIGGSAGKALGMSQQFNSMMLSSAIDLTKDAPLLYGITFKGPSGSSQVSETLWADGVYEEGDRRRDVTLVNNLYYDKSYPHSDRFECRKFLIANDTKPGAFDEWGNNVSIIRYTDVKLMYAEALNEINYGGNITEILSILNEVRKRAGLPAVNATTLDSKETTFEYIVNERFVEFCFEGLRWPDLIRWGLAEEAMEKHFSLESESFNSATGMPMYNMDKRNLLAPIPQIEINAYGNKSVMWQNEGY